MSATHPPVLRWVEVACHYCGAAQGEPCTVYRSTELHDGPHALRLRAASAAHTGWDPGQQPIGTRALGWGTLGTPTQGILRAVATAERLGTFGGYRPDTRSNPSYEWAAIRQGFYTWTPDTGAQLTPLGRELLAQATQ